ncbi:MAG: hypothetical protein GX754_13000 [Clostridiaceae bacterium]|nr:hypothetical protein [Clostridiaceae bacterium]
MHKFTNDLIRLGDSLAAMRTYDLIRALDAIPYIDDKIDLSDIHLYGHGEYSLYAELAAAIDERMK